AEYKGKSRKKNPPKVGLVGKGVTFDTGGISIKGTRNLHYMKSDMGGAAAVLGTVEAAARLKLPIHLIGIVPATDNCVDALAIKPGDVIGSYSGKTIEVIDTDAEGRLILADGLYYMQKHYAPEVMIDLATLTGSSFRTFGFEAAALFSKNTRLANQLQSSGDKTGERCWRLPLWDVYGPEMDSDIADIKNYHGKPFAGAITAAKFLEAFTNDHSAWAHLDIAGVAFNSIGLSDDKSGTGYGVQLLVNYLSQYISKS
ncbi:MAG: leucyl aminopeptidase, partial [Saprospiraceae bacterium]|nr:leucyl aminopeptidase [Saprospiraceae bacterium]